MNIQILTVFNDDKNDVKIVIDIEEVLQLTLLFFHCPIFNIYDDFQIEAFLQGQPNEIVFFEMIIMILFNDNQCKKIMID